MYLLSLAEEINSVPALITALNQAFALEMTVIPPYLTALYSIKDPKSPAATVLQSVLVEEMLHMAMDANLINAIGQGVHVRQAANHLNYPEPLPYKNPKGAVLSLEKCSPEQVGSLFCRIEEPSAQWLNHRPYPPQASNFETLGQFYQAVWDGFNQLGPSIITCPGPQYGLQLYQTGGGELWQVETTQLALDLIWENQLQTSSNDELKPEEPHGPNGMNELAHYYKFKAIAEGRIPIGETYNMKPNVKPDEIHHPLAKDLNLLFDYGFTMLVENLHQLFNKPGKIERFFGISMTLMNQIMKNLAQLMMQIPINSQGQTAGPSYLYQAEGGIPLKATTLARDLLNGQHYPYNSENWNRLSAAYNGFQTIKPFPLDYE